MTTTQGGGSVRKRGHTFYVRYTHHGRRTEERTDAASKTAARAILHERLGDVSKGLTPAAVSTVRLRELYDDKHADCENKGQHLPTLAGRWKHLEPVFGSDFVRTITHRRMLAYIADRRAEGAKPQTIKNELAILRRMLGLGYQTGKVAQVPFFPTIAVDNVRAVFFADSEYEALRDVLPTVLATGRQIGNDWLILYVILIRWIGTRRGEVLRLERRQLNLDAGPDPDTGEDTDTITLDPGTTKNGEGRVIYLPPEALAALREWDEKPVSWSAKAVASFGTCFTGTASRLPSFRTTSGTLPSRQPTSPSAASRTTFAAPPDGATAGAACPKAS